MWRAGWCECGICGHSWVGVWPDKCINSFECPSCGHMAGNEKELTETEEV